MTTEVYAVAALTTIEGVVCGTILVRKPEHVVASWYGWLVVFHLVLVILLACLIAIGGFGAAGRPSVVTVLSFALSGMPLVCVAETVRVAGRSLLGVRELR